MSSSSAIRNPARHRPRLPPPARRAALPPPEELEQLKELLTLLESGKLDLAVGAADRANRYPLSPVGHSYAAMLGTKVHCARTDQAAALSRFRTITEPGHSQEAKSYCKKFIGTELLSP